VAAVHDDSQVYSRPKLPQGLPQPVIAERILPIQIGRTQDLIALIRQKKAMERAINKLIAQGKKGDVLLIHYSGHGSNVPDDNRDEGGYS